jgi:hypothetical protein
MRSLVVSLDDSHEFGALNTLLLVLTLGLCILSAYLVKIYKFYYLPEVMMMMMMMMMMMTLPAGVEDQIVKAADYL